MGKKEEEEEIDASRGMMKGVIVLAIDSLGYMIVV